jgi:pyruvate dehydrogenase E2 component (dihydrolipoamide acetyltransferase)
MAVPILMPQIGQDLETGKIVEWRVHENQPVKKGDILAIVESDKATFEVEAYESGIVLSILHPAGDEANVFSPIGYIGQPGETAPKGSNGDGKNSSDHDSQMPNTVVEKSIAASITVEKHFASPTAKRMAKERGLDCNQMQGSGPRGRVIKRDVLAFIPKTDKAAPILSDLHQVATAGQPLAFSKMRRIIAERMTHSKQTIPHFYLFTEVDMTLAQAWRNAFNLQQRTHITLTDLLIKTTAEALVQFPKLNAVVEGEQLRLKKEINIGIAVSVEDGLLVPVVAQADQKSIQEISDLAKKNAEAARRNVIGNIPGTFTISNLGMYRITGFLPIINPPEVAILGVGCIDKQLKPLDLQTIAIREMMQLSLVCDHRAVDGVYGAKFLDAVKTRLENMTP